MQSNKGKLGVSMSVCVWCGEVKGVAINKKVIPIHQNMPSKAITDYEPCDDCKARWDKGIPVIEVENNPLVEGQFPITEEGGNKYYPTGSYVVIREGVLSDEYKKGQPVLCHTEEFNKIVKAVGGLKYVKENNN